MKRKHAKKTAAVFLAAAVILALTGCAPGRGFGVSGKQQYETSYLDLFDTVTVLKGYAENEEEFADQAWKTEQILRAYHEDADIYHDYELTSWYYSKRLRGDLIKDGDIYSFDPTGACDHGTWTSNVMLVMNGLLGGYDDGTGLLSHAVTKFLKTLNSAILLICIIYMYILSSERKSVKC